MPAGAKFSSKTSGTAFPVLEHQGMVWMRPSGDPRTVDSAPDSLNGEHCGNSARFICRDTSRIMPKGLLPLKPSADPRAVSCGPDSLSGECCLENDDVCSMAGDPDPETDTAASRDCELYLELCPDRHAVCWECQPPQRGMPNHPQQTDIWCQRSAAGAGRHTGWSSSHRVDQRPLCARV